MSLICKTIPMTSAYKFINSFSCEMFCTKSRFEKEAKGNIHPWTAHRSLWFSLSLSLSLFRLLPAYLLPFLLFLFLIIQRTLKCVLSMHSWNLDFVFHSNTEMHRMLRIVKEISRVLSDKRSKYSVVGTKTPKKQ